MSMRYSWKGFVKLSLVTIPVKAYPVAVSGSEVHLHQLHATCKSRVKYKKTCPLHGELISERHCLRLRIRQGALCRGRSRRTR